jgi:hypothetical protein
MEYKYLIIYSGQDGTDVCERAKSIFDCWWTPLGNGSDGIIIVKSDVSKNCADIRDELSKDKVCAITVMKIVTDGNVAVCGKFGNDKTWSWLKNYCDSQLDELLETERNKTLNSITSDSEINIKNGIGL